LNAASASDEEASFDPGESWSFSWNAPTEFAGVSFGAYSQIGGMTLHNDQFSIQSDDWISLMITPGSAEVAFDMSTGTFTFDNVGTDDFSATDLGGAVPVAIGSLITINFTDLDPGGTEGVAHIASLSFNITGVPEPSAFLFGGLLCGVIGAARLRRRLAARLFTQKSAV
jgi:hypothetical protein